MGYEGLMIRHRCWDLVAGSFLYIAVEPGFCLEMHVSVEHLKEADLKLLS